MRTGKHTFLGSALLLMAASFLVKLIGAAYSIPVTNLVGGEGNGIFHAAYSIYTVLFLVSTAGIPSAVSHLVADACARGRRDEADGILKWSLLCMATVGGILSLALAALAGPLSRAVGSSLATLAVRVIAPAVFFTAVSAVIRGYYQGLHNMMPTAWSQVLEALGKLVFGLGLTVLLRRQGCPMETVVAGAVGGVTIGSALSTLAVCLFLLRDPERPDLRRSGSGQGRSALHRLWSVAVPITLGASVISVINLTDTALFMNLLQRSGMSEADSNFYFGCYNIAVKLYTMPQLLATAFSVSAVPAVSRAFSQGDREGARSAAETSVRFTALVTAPCGAGMAVLASPILRVLYGSVPEEAALAAPQLTLMAPCILLTGLISVSSAILQGVQRPRQPLYAMAAGVGVKIFLECVLTGSGALIYGASVSTAVCCMVIAAMDLWFIRQAGLHLRLAAVCGKPVLAALGMGGAVWGIYRLLSAAGQLISLAGAVLAGVIIYFALTAAMKTITREEALMLPGGKTLARILRL